MSESTLTIGHGSALKLGNGATPEVFTTVDGTTSVSFGSSKTDILDNTELGTAGTIRSFQSGLRDRGEVTVKINVRPGNASQASLKAAWDGALHNFKVEYPGAAITKSFSAFIVAFDEEIPDDKKPTYSVKLKINGDITEA